ncbi:hypothetical protein ARMSODRAFT_976272 [Armillaria solidipes]|uniref:Uncharacterized protein n=1 Tax=Armillaria solidipes TaxID=1076256 RepID=A0A2H3BAV7_9AGAR|nr:hypothetical protein ARMSODRAFT_976272 [Armillaria solidipes]
MRNGGPNGFTRCLMWPLMEPGSFGNATLRYVNGIIFIWSGSFNSSKTYMALLSRADRSPSRRNVWRTSKSIRGSDFPPRRTLDEIFHNEMKILLEGRIQSPRLIGFIKGLLPLQLPCSTRKRGHSQAIFSIAVIVLSVSNIGRDRTEATASRSYCKNSDDHLGFKMFASYYPP